MGLSSIPAKVIGSYHSRLFLERIGQRLSRLVRYEIYFLKEAGSAILHFICDKPKKAFLNPGRSSVFADL